MNVNKIQGEVVVYFQSKCHSGESRSKTLRESIQLGLDVPLGGHDNSFFILNTQSSPLPTFRYWYVFAGNGLSTVPTVAKT